MNKGSLANDIRAAGFRATKPRLLLLGHLQKNKSPRSILEIAEALTPSIDQVTVYRIVEAFKKTGLIREIDLRQGRPLYEIADSHDHHHVVCVSCDRVEDFTGCESEKLADRALKQVKGFSLINSHSLEFFGMCTNCVTKRPSTV